MADALRASTHSQTGPNDTTAKSAKKSGLATLACNVYVCLQSRSRTVRFCIERCMHRISLDDDMMTPW